MAEVKKGDVLIAAGNGPKEFKVVDIDSERNVTLEEVRANSELPADTPDAQPQVVITAERNLIESDSWVGKQESN